MKYKVVGHPVFGIYLEVKVRLDQNICVWFNFGQVICSVTKIDFLKLELMRNVFTEYVKWLPGYCSH